VETIIPRCWCSRADCPRFLAVRRCGRSCGQIWPSARRRCAPLIVGFNVGAGAEKTVLIRAVGPLRVRGPGSAGGSAAGAVRLGWPQDRGERQSPCGGRAGVRAGWGRSRAGRRVPRTRRSLAAGEHRQLRRARPGRRRHPGTALVEVYAVGANWHAAHQLRAKVGTGDAILDPLGWVLSPGATSRRLLMRAVGPGLAPFGVTGLLADPRLELYQGGTRIAGERQPGARRWACNARRRRRP
jgi:hypothetical protein